jgi:4-amino-4-deoxy-L-arabinose transferase-like glycosyltransferase
MGLARAAVGALVLAWGAMFAVRMLGSSDLMDNDQLRPGMYTLDVVLHGRWLIQTDPTGDVASKPPMYVWWAAAIALLTGRVDEWALYVPTGAAILAITLMAARAAGGAFGPAAGWLAGAAFLLSPYAAKHMALARTDAMFACFVTAAALLALRAWATGSGRGWMLFWMAAAAATLTKGPLGVAVAAMGLIACLWERGGEGGGRVGRGRKLVLGHGVGVGVYLAVTAGWFIAAYAVAGQPLIDKMIGRELLGHAAASDGGAAPFTGLYKPPLYLLTRFAPWSVFACIGVWRAIARPAAAEGERRCERFLVSWLLGGLAIFCAAPHQRADLLLPIVPAAAMLAGRELARLGGSRLAARLPWAIACVTVVALAAVALDRGVVKRSDPMVLRTRAVRDFAGRFDAMSISAELLDVDAPFALQFFLQMHRPRVTPALAAVALAGAERVIVARGGFDPGVGGRVIAMLEDPAKPGTPLVVLYTNDPALRVGE